MKRALLLALLCCAVLPARADEPRLAPPAGPEAVMVERRLLVKESHWFFSLGLGWLARSDYYDNPGLAASIAYWPIESTAVELRIARYFSSLSGPAQAVFDQTGLTPDAQQPGTRLMAGVRHDVAYGKLARAGGVIHFDLQLAAHAGTLITDRSVTPAVDVAAGVMARLSRRWFAQLDVAVLASLEDRVRSSSFVLALLPELSIGFSL